MSLGLSKEHLEFEIFCKATNYKESCTWHDELDRYTVMSVKQKLWETWLAARGIPYTYKTGV